MHQGLLSNILAYVWMGNGVNEVSTLIQLFRIVACPIFRWNSRIVGLAIIPKQLLTHPNTEQGSE